MADIEYTTVPGKITPLLAKMREAAIPPNATTKWLKSIGFTSTNDRSLISVLKWLGFIDKGGVPTTKWSG